MKLTWVSGDFRPQSVAYFGGPQLNLTVINSTVITFNKSDLCVNKSGPAASFGWHDPGFIHSALLTGLLPSSTYTYRYGSDLVGWSLYTNFTTPPAPAGSATVRFIAYGDMGKAERDGSIEHYIQPGSLQVIDAVTAEVLAGNVDAIFHIGDISYATGFIAEWDFFLEMIHPVASKVPYLTAIGNHERDFPESGSFYTTTDSGGECGVPYETHFQMPIQGKDMPWYSIELGPVHFTIMSTEHNWTLGSDQYNWIANDLASVNRTRTPWLIFTGHRPQYSTVAGGLLSDLVPPSVDPIFAPSIEPLFVMNKVDLVLWGHVHNYERTCAVFQGICSLLPTKDTNGTDTYMGTPYRAPVHAVIGMSGFTLDPFATNPANWSLARASAFGYVRVEAAANQLLLQYILSSNGTIGDSFKIVK
ncbi:hypothetical protein O6H91_17G062300 [Diphasiastrum complanatum]|nr:hypothetical protein O6H91_17G062300 [Diphasiastrum complanatum]